jgi:hypothetical protein
VHFLECVPGRARRFNAGLLTYPRPETHVAHWFGAAAQVVKALDPVRVIVDGASARAQLKAACVQPQRCVKTPMSGTSSISAWSVERLRNTSRIESLCAYRMKSPSPGVVLGGFGRPG